MEMMRLNLAGQPLHKRGRRVWYHVYTRVTALVRSCYARTRCVQNRTRENLTPMKIWHLIGQHEHLRQPHNIAIGDDVEQSDWAALLAAAVQLRGSWTRSRAYKKWACCLIYNTIQNVSHDLKP